MKAQELRRSSLSHHGGVVLGGHRSSPASVTSAAPGRRHRHGRAAAAGQDRRREPAASGGRRRAAGAGGGPPTDGTGRRRSHAGRRHRHHRDAARRERRHAGHAPADLPRVRPHAGRSAGRHDRAGRGGQRLVARMRRTPSATSRRPASPISRSTSTTRPPTRWSRRRCRRWPPARPPASCRSRARRPRPARPRPPAPPSSSPRLAWRRTGGPSRRPSRPICWRSSRRCAGSGLSFNESIGAIVKSMIQSPNFLYHWEIGPTTPVVGSDGLVPLTSWQLASRLASTIWETTPDDTLLQAAQAGQLTTPAAGRQPGDPHAGGSARRQRALLFQRAVAVQLRKSGTRSHPAAHQVEPAVHGGGRAGRSPRSSPTSCRRSTPATAR